ncbi:MAG TPA: diguanylate cyclase [Terriglobales bacterium]|nr:diguanylate cyclase [Terriglobales bacterium]
MQKIAILYDASQAVLSTFELDEVLSHILAIARDFFHLQHAAVLLFDKEKEELYVRRQIGGAPELDHARYPMGAGIVGVAAQKKRPICVPDVSKDSRYVKAIAGTRSQLAIPLIVNGEVAGVLDCQSENPGHFDSETTDLLALFSTQASMALQNAELYTLERQRAAQLRAINSIAQEMNAVLDLKELLSRIGPLIRQAFLVSHVSILVKQEDNVMLMSSSGDLTSTIGEGSLISRERAPCAEAFATGKTVIENDVKTLPGYIALCLETSSRISIPLVSFGQVLGMLVLDSDKLRRFSDDEVQPLESVAGICATAIQNAHYVDRVKQLAYLDGLTGIFNRRYFELRMVEEIERARRFNSSMSVIMIDIDHFKRLNDEFGHLLGDEVLRQVSSIFNQQVRKMDVVCRYGGEEFAILLSQTDPQYSLTIAEKLRTTVDSWSFPGVPQSVTISAGAATYPAHGMTRDELVKAADSALYAAKQAGRNCVRLAVPSDRSAACSAGK